MDDRCNRPARLSSGTRRHSADCNPDYQRQSAGGCTVWRTESAHPVREVKLRMARYSFWIGSQGSRAQRGALLALAAILLCSISAISVFIALFLGTVLGLAAAFFAWLDTLIMRLTDVLLALPSLLLSIAV